MVQEYAKSGAEVPSRGFKTLYIKYISCFQPWPEFCEMRIKLRYQQYNQNALNFC